MSERTKRILAVIALVFMGVFTVTFVVFLVTRGNIEAFITLFSGVIGIGLFFVIKMFSKKEPTGEEAETSDDDSVPCDGADETDAADSEEKGDE